jgi:hypothetical protein
MDKSSDVTNYLSSALSPALEWFLYEKGMNPKTVP